MGKDLLYSTKPLVEALAEYDRTAPERNALWDKVDTNADVHAAEQVEADALAKVREAFYQVTRDRNSRDNCMRVDIDFMRRAAMMTSEEDSRQ